MAGITLYGKALRKLRVEHELMLKALSEKLDEELSPAYLSAIEIGKRAIPHDLSDKVWERSVENFKKLCKLDNRAKIAHTETTF